MRTTTRSALIWGVAIALNLLACSSRGHADSSKERAAAARNAPPAAGANPNVEVVAVVDLPREPRTQTLSGTWFDPSTRTLFALKDREPPTIVPFAVSEDFHALVQGTPLALTGRPNSKWDGE